MRTNLSFLVTCTCNQSWGGRWEFSGTWGRHQLCGRARICWASGHPSLCSVIGYTLQWLENCYTKHYITIYRALKQNVNRIQYVTSFVTKYSWLEYIIDKNIIWNFSNLRWQICLNINFMTDDEGNTHIMAHWNIWPLISPHSFFLLTREGHRQYPRDKQTRRWRRAEELRVRIVLMRICGSIYQ